MWRAAMVAGALAVCGMSAMMPAWAESSQGCSVCVSLHLLDSDQLDTWTNATGARRRANLSRSTVVPQGLEPAGQTATYT
jgi:hypothetical protein